MKLFSKLLLTVLGFLLLLGGIWLSLPQLLASMAESQLAQSGFSNVEVKIGGVTLQSVVVDSLRMSNTDMEVSVEGLQLNYDIPRLLSGQLISLEAKSIELKRLTSNEDATFLPDPAALSSILLTPWQQYNPADFISLDKLSLYDANGNLSFTASMDISRQGESTLAEVRLLDNEGKNHSVLLLVSDDSVDLRWLSPDSEIKHPISVLISPNADASGLAGQASVNLSAINDIMPELGEMSGQMQAEFSFLRQVAGDKKEISLSANIVDAAIADSGAKSVLVNVDAVITEKDDGFNLQFSPSSTVKFAGLRQGKNSVEKASFVFPRTLDFVAGRPLLESKNGAKIAISNAILDNIKIPILEIKDIAITAKQATESQVDCSFILELNVPVLAIDDIKIQASPYKVDGICPGADSTIWLVNAKTDSVTIESNEFKISLAECNATANTAKDGNLEEILGDAVCQNKTSSGQVDTRFVFNSRQGSGYADYSFSGITPDSGKPLISSLIKDWQQSFDLVSGTVSAKGRYSWWKNKKGQDKERLVMDLKVDDAGGYYEGVLFSGLNYQDRLDILPDIKSSGFAPLTVTDIDVGIPITSFKTELSLNKSRNGTLPSVTLKGLSMSLLDGKVMGNDLKFDMNSDSNELVLIVDGLDLAQIVEMQKLEGLEATGRLDGYIPVTVTNNGIKITSGKIVAQEQGGYIRYRPAGGTSEIEKSAVGSEFVFRIIEDLDYNSLTINVDYTEDGEMDMKFAIKGMSPKVDTHRPVHFNLNLQQNVLQLLRGLRYAEGLSEGIDKNVQKLFRK